MKLAPICGDHVKRAMHQTVGADVAGVLKDIGVSSAGHRLRIRNAIAKLNAPRQSDSAGNPPIRPERNPPSVGKLL
jgi:hypothetical protein